MKCSSVRNKLPGYLDGALASSHSARLQEHLGVCPACREDLERYRRLAVLLSHKPSALPPADLAVRIRVAAAQARTTQEASGHFREWLGHAKIVLENAYRPLAVPATGGLVTAMLIFILALQLIVPGITVRAVQNDVPINLMRPA